MRARVALPLLLAAGVLGAPAVTFAAPSMQACIDASEKGQRARAAGKMREAHEQFLVCGGEGCPTIVRKDCAQWNSELAQTIPTVVFGAHDKSGRDLFDVTVSMDGEVLVTKLDGKAVSVDPGPHTFRFEHAGFAAVTQRVLVKEGERPRVLDVTFDTSAATATASSPSDLRATPSAEQADASEHSGHTVFPWILVGAGAVAATIGVVLFATTPDRPANCNEETKRCTPLPNQSEEDFREDQTRAGTADTQPTVALVVAAGGGALVAGGLVWFLLEPTGKKSGARVTPWTTGRAGGLSVGGTF